VKVSLVYTMRDRTDLLQRSLFALCCWFDYNPSDVELVVVEDVSEDKSLPKMLKEYKPYFEKIVHIKMDKTKSKIPVFFNNPALGMNLAVKHASYDCIVKTDPECLPITDVIGAAQRLFSKDSLYFFSVRMLNEGETNNFSMDNLRQTHPEDLYQSLERGRWYISTQEKLPYWFGAIFSRDKFIEIGGIEEEYLKGFAAEDDSLAEMLQRNGVTWKWSDELKTLHMFHGLENRKHHLSAAHLHNIALLKQEREMERKRANEEHDWGSEQVVVERRVI
jgi:hypothetical protein